MDEPIKIDGKDGKRPSITFGRVFAELTARVGFSVFCFEYDDCTDDILRTWDVVITDEITSKPFSFEITIKPPKPWFIKYPELMKKLKNNEFILSMASDAFKASMKGGPTEICKKFKSGSTWDYSI